MDVFRFEGFLKEFPFLTHILDEKKWNDPLVITSISVQRVDKNFLNKTLRDSYIDGSMGESILKEELWAVVKGSPKSVKTQDEIIRYSNFAHSGGQEFDGQPILGSLVEYSEAEFLVLLVRDYDCWEGHQKTDKYSVVIYKASKHTTIAKEIEKARQIATTKIKIEADF